MNKRAFVLILIILIMIFSSCSYKDFIEDLTKDTVKIGWIGSLTGDRAKHGKTELQALVMLIEETNANGGLLGEQLELVPFDIGQARECSGTKSAVSSLLIQNKLIAVIGPGTTDQAVEASKALEENKIPMIATLASGDRLTVDEEGEVKPYTFRVCFTDSEAGYQLGKYAYEKLNFKTASILADDLSHHKGLSESFSSGFIEAGGLLYSEDTLKTGDDDFRNQLLNVRKYNPDCMLILTTVREVSYLANQARQFGIDSTFICGDFLHSSELMLVAGNVMEGSYILSHSDDEKPEAMDLKARYRKRWHNDEPENDIYLVHDAFELLKKAIESANSFDRDDIAFALTDVEIEGISGRIKLSIKTHNPFNKRGVLYTIENGKFKTHGVYE